MPCPQFAQKQRGALDTESGKLDNQPQYPSGEQPTLCRPRRPFLSSETRGMSQQPRRRRLEVEDSGDVAVVQFVDKKILDEQNIQMIGDDLFRLVDELGRRKILLNFGNVEFLSSAALGKLITMNRKVQAVRGKLVLCNISREIREVFEITKLDKLFTILPDEQAALQSF
jgi:anti-sigma B factor antagonist